jgi:hypothetical protein
LSGPEWQDLEGKGADKGLVGEALKLSVSCNGDMEEGAGVTFRVYQEGADPKRDRAEAELASGNRGGKAEAEWTYQYRHDPEKPLTEKPKFYFVATGRRCREAKSGNVEISKNYRILLEVDENVLANTKCKILLSDNTMENGITDENGVIKLDAKTPGIVQWVEYTGAGGETKRIDAASQNE